MWAQAMDWAVKRTAAEDAWLKQVKSHLPEYQRMVSQLQSDGVRPTALEWAKKIARKDLDVIDGTASYNRDSPPEDVKQLKLLRGTSKRDE